MNMTNMVLLSFSSIWPQKMKPSAPTMDMAMCQAMNLTMSTLVAVPTLMPRARIWIT